MLVNYELLVFGLLFLLIFEYTNLIFDKIWIREIPTVK